jgi:hypothetical protein
LADNTIRVLGIYPTGSTISTAYMSDQLNGISQAWNATALTLASGGVAIELVNGGQPVPVSLTGLPRTIAAVYNWAFNDSAITAQRNFWSADVVVLFVPFVSGTTCGGSGSWWSSTHVFIGNSQGLDLRGQNNAYHAVIGNACPLNATAHEFGHMLGGGHRLDDADGTNLRFYPDSRAFMFLQHIYIPEWGIDIYYEESTALGTAGSFTASNVFVPECPVSTSFCVFDNIYSSIGGLGDSGHNNARTLSQTARSVANYVTSPSPPTPVLNPPINVTGFVTEICDSYGYGGTSHLIFWNDDPQTNVPISFYIMWGSQPPGLPYQFGWTITSPQRFSPAWVWGADALAKLSACSTTQCSALSSSSYLAKWLCGNPH